MWLQQDSRKLLEVPIRVSPSFFRLHLSQYIRVTELGANLLMQLKYASEVMQ
jgi:hypothetical protein